MLRGLLCHTSMKAAVERCHSNGYKACSHSQFNPIFSYANIDHPLKWLFTLPALCAADGFTASNHPPTEPSPRPAGRDPALCWTINFRMMHACITVAVGQGEARYKPKEERRQEHPGFGASQLYCIWQGWKSFRRGWCPSSRPEVGRDGGAEAGTRAETYHEGFGTASSCIVPSSKAALELLTGTSRVCHVTIIRASELSQPLMGHPRAQQGWVSTTGHPGAALRRGCALGRLKMLTCGV